MGKVYVFLADGFETVEAMAPIDVMRRAGLQVVVVSIMGRLEVVSAQGVKVLADLLFDAASFVDADALVLPGGGIGTENLSAFLPLHQLLVEMDSRAGIVAAICAAPMVLGRAGILKGRKATCYPGCEGELNGAIYTASCVEEDGNIITGCGPAASFDFGFAITARLCGKDVVETLRSQMQFE